MPRPEPSAIPWPSLDLQPQNFTPPWQQPAPTLTRNKRPKAESKPEPEKEPDPCAECKKKAKQNRKPRKPRDKCFSGIYQDRLKGITKHPGKEITCQ